MISKNDENVLQPTFLGFVPRGEIKACIEIWDRTSSNYLIMAGLRTGLVGDSIVIWVRHPLSIEGIPNIVKNF